jgi:hypothetical protein
VVADDHGVVAHRVHRLDEGAAFGCGSEQRVAYRIAGVEQQSASRTRFCAHRPYLRRDAVESADCSAGEIAVPAGPRFQVTMYIVRVQHGERAGVGAFGRRAALCTPAL